MKKLLYLLLFFVFLVVCTVGCSKNNSKTNVTVIDLAGDAVTIPEQITGTIVRVNAASFIAAFGKADIIKGTYKYIANNIWADFLYPGLGQARNFKSSPTAESFYELNANMSIWGDSKLNQSLREKGLAAFTWDIYQADDMRESVKLLASIFGKSTWAEEWSKYYDKTISLIADRTKNINDKTVVYYVHGAGNEGIYHTAAGGTMSEKWINHSGGLFATHGTVGFGIDITPEELIKFNPQVIVIGGVYYESMMDTLYSEVSFSELDAIKYHRIYNVPVGLIPWDQYGLEYPLLCLWTAKTLYPELFSDIDIHQETMDFYKKFCGISLSSEKVDFMLAGKGPNGEPLVQ